MRSLGILLVASMACASCDEPSVIVEPSGSDTASRLRPRVVSEEILAPSHPAGAGAGGSADLDSLPWEQRIALEQAMAERDERYAPRTVLTGPLLQAPGGAVATITDSGALLEFGAQRATLRVAAIGRGDVLHEVNACGSVVIAGAVVRTSRGEGVTEWWRSLPSGLEHGVTIGERPAGNGELVVDLAVGGDLSPRAASDDAVALVDARGAHVASYAHLLVLDASGARVSARLAVAAGHIRIEVADAGARYPLTIDPLLYGIEEATLLASSGGTDLYFGQTVALAADGSRALVGAPFEDTAGGANAGSVRVFVRSGVSWTQEATLLAADGAANDQFGFSIALNADGSRALVGAYLDDIAVGADAGSVRVFVRTGTTWSVETTILGATRDRLGTSVALTGDGSRALVGVPGSGTLNGSVRVYLRTGTSWASEATLLAVGGALADDFGSSVAVTPDGGRAVVGARYDDTADGRDAGSARVFLRTGTNWAEEATLLASGGAADDYFGNGVALSADGSRALVGGVGAVSARVFVRAGTNWSTEATLSAAADFVGNSVALTADGTRALVGNHSDDTLGMNAGSARIFVRSGTSWSPDATLLALGGAAGDLFGYSVALTADGSRALVGAQGDDAAGFGFDAGSVRVFSFVPGAANGTPCGTGAQCLSGSCSDGVCCDTPCGGSDATDCQACSAGLTGGPSGTCAPLTVALASTVTCRPAGGDCNAADVCSPTSTACPADAFVPAVTICRPSANTCDTAERCTGSSSTCPVDAPTAFGTVCRAAAGPCDPEDSCDGTSYACPGDTRLPAGVACRPASGPCDVSEACDGSSVACPADGFLASVVCRAAVGPCDVEDRCDGTSAGCPDVFAMGTMCRPVSGPCDLADLCAGTGASCPVDAVRAAGFECAASSGGVCDAPDVCTGSTTDCPPVYLSGVECRASGGACDAAEVCLGDAAGCPPDGVLSAGLSCRTSTDTSCDPEEMCDGASVACPSDVTMCIARPDGGSGAVDAGPLAPATGCACGIASARPLGAGVLDLLIGALGLLVLGRRRQMKVGRPVHRSCLSSAWTRVARYLVHSLSVLVVWGLTVGCGGEFAAETSAAAPATEVAAAVGGAQGAGSTSLDALPWAERIGIEQTLAASDARYAPRMDESGPVLATIDSGMVATFSRDGAHITLGGGVGRAVTLAFVGIGRRGAVIRTLSASAGATIAGAEVRAERGGGITEWWRSLPSGLEHGVTVAERPGGEGGLILELEVGGDLSPHTVSADSVALLDASGAHVATYAHLLVLDADGAPVAARLSVADGHIRIELDDAGARYPIIIDPLLYVTEEATLLASAGAPGDYFGYSVALSADGTRALVGALSNAGSARVFRRTGSTWVEEAILLASGAAPGDRFGSSVSLSADGTRALVGAYRDDTLAGTDAGSARVFVRTGSSWAEEAVLLATGGGATDEFGYSVALSADGSRAVIGARHDDVPSTGVDAGSVHVFLRAGASWTAEATLVATGAQAGDEFGYSVALAADGSRAVVGAYLDDTAGGADAGSSRVFLRTGTSWAEEATLLASGGAAGDFFGFSVAISADASRALVGAFLDDTAASANAGSARVFLRTGTTWTEEGTLLAAGAAVGARLGASVSLSGDGSRAVVGASTFVGFARVFLRSGVSWTDEGTLRGTGATEDDFGTAVAFSADGSRALVGARAELTTGGFQSGSARVFLIAAGAANGTACGTGPQCLTGFCSDGVCCDVACGGSDASDCRACSAALTGRPSGTCGTLSAAVAGTVTCRAAATVCDAPDACSASSTACPGDAFMPATTVCRPVSSACDALETCTGSNIVCPADAPAAGGVGCRPSLGTCDGAEICDGTSYACPADTRLPSGVACRPASGPCDAPEACDGVSAGCPVDGFLASVVCRAAIGPCDVEDRCDGASAGCPDVFAVGTTCRSMAGPCDIADFCDGTGASCPIDVVRAAGVECAASSGGVCDAPDVCTGSSTDCPPIYLSGVECRASAGACDAAEMCLGDATACPPDGLLSAGLSCRASTDTSCDPEEMCDGASVMCPGDVTTCAARDGGPGADDAGAEPPAPATGCACVIGSRRPVNFLALLLGVVGLLVLGSRGGPMSAQGRRMSVARHSLLALSVSVVGLVAMGCGREVVASTGALPAEVAVDVTRNSAGSALDALPWAERVGIEQSLAASDTRHAPRMADGGPVLETIDSALVASFSREGARITLGADSASALPGHTVTLASVGIGRPGAMHALEASAGATIAGPEVRTELGEGVTEWWRSLPSGLEHGVTVAEPPEGEGELIIDVDVGGALSPDAVSPDAVALLDASGAHVATYAHLLVLDAVRARLSARLSVVEGRIRIELDDSGARYPIIIDPLLYVTEEATLLASAGAPGDYFGNAVALSADGTRAIVGAYTDQVGSRFGAGSARVFRRAGSSWVEEAVLLASGNASDDNFGSSVALSADGTRALVGAPFDDTVGGQDAGSARVFLRTGTSWVEEATLLALAGTVRDRFGGSVVLGADGSRALVGAASDDTAAGVDAGSARVFLRVGSSWTEEATLIPTGGAAGDNLGFSVALSGDASRAVVGARGDDTAAGANAGSVRVFSRTGTSWAEEATLQAVDAVANDLFGYSVALSTSGNRALVGAAYDDTARGIDAGSAHVFLRTGTSWAEEAALVASDGGTSDTFGTSVTLSGDGSRALVGAPYDATPVGTYAGTVHPFVRTGAAWVEQPTLFASDAAVSDVFGCSVALSGDGSLGLVGAYGDGANLGSARVLSLAAGATNGSSCSSGAECVTGFCTDGVCCNVACGGSVGDDCQACATALTGIASGTCAPLSSAVASATTCRAAMGVCDLPDVCSPSSTACPPSFVAPTSVCRLATSDCDAAETCTGVSPDCPSNAAAAAGVACRGSVGACDAPEACDGLSFVCPADRRIPAGATCRPPTGACDASEACDGSSISCPPDGFLAGVVCRAAVGPCDVEDRCDAVSAGCPNVFSMGTTCRPAAGPCDVADLCDGAGASCPNDMMLAAGVVCAASSGGVCDAPDVCSGSSANCTPGYLSGVECRASDGACDAAELCLGDAAGCPPDGVLSAGLSCRASTDSSCDPEETCDGTSAMCPVDETVCMLRADGGAGTDDAGAPAPATGCTCETGSRRTPALPLSISILALASVALRRRSIRRPLPGAPRLASRGFKSGPQSAR